MSLLNSFFALQSKLKTLFKFDRSWLEFDGISNIVSDAWKYVGSHSNAASNLVQKLRATRIALKDWSALVRRQSRADKEKLMGEIQKLDQREEIAPLSPSDRDLKEAYRLELQNIFKGLSTK